MDGATYACGAQPREQGDARNQIGAASVVLKKLAGMDVKNKQDPRAVRNSMERAYSLSSDGPTSLWWMSA